MNTIILIKLIAAHLTGDFLLQSDRMCADKFSKHSVAKYKALVIHALIQAVLAYVFVAQWNCWIIPAVIGVSNFLIDYVKSMCKRKDLEGLIPNAPNALISIRYRLANYLYNEYVTNNFHHFQRLSCRHPDRLVSLCEVNKIYVRLQVRGFDLENNNTEC